MKSGRSGKIYSTPSRASSDKAPGAESCAFFALKHLRIGESVSYIDVGEQIDRVRGIVFDFLAKLANEGAQVFDFFTAIGSPDGSKQLGIRHDTSGAAHQAIEDVVLLASEVDGLSALGDAAFRRGEANFADLDGGVFCAGRGVDASNRGSDSRDEFAGAEGLGDVVVRSQFEGFDLFFFAFAHGYHENRQPRGKRANAAKSLDTADPGHIDVEKHHIVLVPEWSNCKASSPREASLN